MFLEQGHATGATPDGRFAGTEISKNASSSVGMDKNGVTAHTDIFLYDIKAVDEAVHRRCTGRSNKQILENLAFLVENKCDIEIRYPFVPGWNDTEAEAIAKQLKGLAEGLRIRILPYHRFAGSKYASLGKVCTLPDTLPEKEELERVRTLMRGHGLQVL